MRHVKQSSLEIVFHYRCRRRDRRFADRLGDCLAKAFTMNWIRDAQHEKIRDEGEEAIRREIFRVRVALVTLVQHCMHSFRSFFS